MRGFLRLAAVGVAVLLMLGGPALAACGDGTLDPGEQCDDGNLLNGDCCSAACMIELAGTICRPSTGACDPAEACNGSSPSCPPNSLTPEGVVCRSSRGACDMAERCTGTTATCPADVLRPAGAVCRESVNDCDVAETCNGASLACPPDAFRPDGAPCNDGHGCTGSDVCAGGTCQGVLEVENCADDFLRYKATPATVFVAIPGIRLTDEFEDVLVDVLKLNGLASPADKNDQQQLDPWTHLETYLIRARTPHVRQRLLTVENELGTVILDTVRPASLLVPTATSLTTPPAPPEGYSVDHFKCYRAIVSRGTPRFTPLRVSVSDRFTATPKVFDLRRPRYLCNPVALNGGEIRNPDAHLLCYQAKAASGEPRFTPVPRVQANNELGPSVLRVVREAELCVPSIIR